MGLPGRGDWDIATIYEIWYSLMGMELSSLLDDKRDPDNTCM